jgi:hypothetical protein
MEQKSRSRLFVGALYLVVILVLGILGYFGISSRLSASQQLGTQAAISTSQPAAQELRACDDKLVALCFLSSGVDGDGNTLITFRAGRSVPKFYLMLRSTDTETVFNCQSVEFAAETVYCLGSYTSEDPSPTVEIYAVEDDRLLATGVLSVSGGVVSVPEPTETLSIAASPTLPAPTLAPTPSPTEPGTTYPNSNFTPSYPTYP